MKTTKEVMDDVFSVELYKKLNIYDLELIKEAMIKFTESALYQMPTFSRGEGESLDQRRFVINSLV